VGGATLVWVPAQGGESGIDATEVTRSQYDTWLSTAPSMSGQPSYCAWNGSFTPDCEWPPGTKGGHPVVCVDWCDASAYCKAVGKRLCGKIGGGSNGYEDFADATTSQWHNACSSAGQHTYPYGDAYEALTCNGSEKGVGTTVVAGNLIGCQSSASGYAGVYDLSGNVWEWEDSCAAYAGTMDACLLRGGAFSGGVDYLRCDRVNHDSRHARFDSVGFRCCAR
jgi:formylglycine-generating enzyme required for sulfatase activity